MPSSALRDSPLDSRLGGRPSGLLHDERVWGDWPFGFFVQALVEATGEQFDCSHGTRRGLGGWRRIGRVTESAREQCEGLSACPYAPRKPRRNGQSRTIGQLRRCERHRAPRANSVTRSATLFVVPSSHPRVGLVLDEDMSSALALVREHVGSSVSQAGLVRTAVFEGVALEAILREAATDSAGQEAAIRLVRDMRALLETLTLPRPVKEGVIEELDRVGRDTDVQQRRRRQRALLNSSNPHGRAASDIKETFDAFERQPA